MEVQTELCPKDGYPIITLIDEKKVCAAEYLDKYAGNCKVDDIFFANSRNVLFALQFENGTLLPVLCPNCNGSKVFADCGNAHCPKCDKGVALTQNYSRELIGYSLDGFRLIESKMGGFELEFSKNGKKFKLATALKAIRMLYSDGVPYESNCAGVSKTPQ